MQYFTTNNFCEWREQARYCLYKQIAPDEVQWTEVASLQSSLFNPETTIACSMPKAYVVTKVPRSFMKLAKIVASHRDPQKWTLLYTALWRIAHQEPHLLELSTDALVRQLFLLYKAVRRAVHKMKAFVRFQLQQFQGQDYYLAWHEPPHNVLELVAPFFQERFKTMLWAIFTPDGYICWNGVELKISREVIKIETMNDHIESLWLTYYQFIFNPARIKLKAMRKEMPVHYWPTLPETKLIPFMLQEATARINKMLT